MDVRVGPLRKLSAEEWMLLNCGVGKNTCVIRVVSSAYMRLWIFLPAILTLAYNSSSPAFRMVYSACKLNKQGDNIQP